MANKKELLGLYKWFRQNLTPPISIDDIYQERLHFLRVQGWDSLHPKEIDTLRLLIALGKKIDLQPLDDLIASLEGVKKMGASTMDKKTKDALVASAASLEEARAAATKLWAGQAEPTDEERFNDRVNEVPDLENAANEILETLVPLRDVDSVPEIHAKSLADAIGNAGSCEKEVDLDANLADAMQSADDLRKALIATKKFLKEAEDDQLPGEDDKAAAEEAVQEAISMLRSLVSDIKNI